MLMVILRLSAPIHRHTGGLEKSIRGKTERLYIHRHTGGLENHAITTNHRIAIHRHTGGLEIAKIYTREVA